MFGWALVWGLAFKCRAGAQDTARCTYVAGHVQGAACSVDTFTPPGAARCPTALRNRQGQDSTCPGSPGTQSLWLHRYILKGQIIKIFMKTKKNGGRGSGRKYLRPSGRVSIQCGGFY